MREALKMEKVRGQMPEGVERQKRGAGSGARTNVNVTRLPPDRECRQEWVVVL